MGLGFGALAGLVGIDSASSLVGSYVQNYFNKKAASKQYDYTKSLIDYENEYNKPVNMRARLEEAGYNPNLALNGVNVTSATGSAPTVQPSKIDLKTNLLQAYNLEEQNKLLQAQNRLTNQNANLAQYNTQIAENNASLSYAKRMQALYNADYAQQEHRAWELTGKIPESYYKNMNLLGSVSRSFDQLLQYFSN